MGVREKLLTIDHALKVEALAEILDVPITWVGESARSGPLRSARLNTGHYVRLDPKLCVDVLFPTCSLKTEENGKVTGVSFTPKKKRRKLW